MPYEYTYYHTKDYYHAKDTILGVYPLHSQITFTTPRLLL